MARSYEIKERPAHLGGGWCLKMFEDGEEMGRGYYPLFRQDRPLGVDEDEDEDEVDPVTKDLFALAEAEADGESWIAGGDNQ